MDDRGLMVENDTGISFEGRKQSIQLNKITNVRLDRPVFPLFGYLVAGIVNVLMFVIYGFSAVSALPPSFTTPFIIFLVAFFFISLAFTVWINRRQWWIVIEGIDKNGESQSLRLYNSKSFGWNAILGGNQQIVERLQERVAA